jgi:hypothetical protein
MSKARDLANAGTALTTVSATELGYLDGVTSAVQTQIDSKIGQSTAINPTIVDAKGDIIAASAADTVSKLTVGANDTVLTADSSTATGLKWATPAAGGMTSIATGTLSGTSVTISSIPSTYINLYLVLNNPYTPTGDQIGVRLNGNTGNNYRGVYGETAGTAWSAPGASSFLDARNFSSTTSTVYGTWTWLIENYASSTGQKPITMMGTASTMGVFGIQYFNSAAAITSMTIINTVGSFSGGTYTLYGIK